MTKRFPLLLILFSAFAALAQDPATVGSEAYKCSLDNERVRVCEVTFRRGASVPMHSHPDHVIYVVSGGKLSLTSGGRTRQIEFKPGQALFVPAETHSAVNTGSTDLRLLVVELKSAPTATRAMAADQAPEPTQIQQLAMLMATSRLLEAEALSRYVHVPDRNTFEQITDALALASKRMHDTLINGRDQPCPGGSSHVDSMCMRVPFDDLWGLKSMKSSAQPKRED